MAKREAVMLAHQFPENPSWADYAGWFMSEKLDGQRAFWDGGLTRGTPVGDVPFANTHKDAIRINANYFCTGLWSRNMKVIFAPDWFLDLLPKVPLDGELFAGRGNWELNASIVRTRDPNKVDWSNIRYMVFDSPSYSDFFAPGIINTDLFRVAYDESTAPDCEAIADKKGIQIKPKELDFASTVKWINNRVISNSAVAIHKQQQIPYVFSEIESTVVKTMEGVIAFGGEGLMLRRPESYWTPCRSHTLLKLKKWEDAEAMVMGYVWGKATDKGSKHLGRMGAMIVEWKGKRFEISGFRDDERKMVYIGSGLDASMDGKTSPGKEVDFVRINNPKFPTGTMISFRYRELTAAGIPKSGNYYRKSLGE